MQVPDDAIQVTEDSITLNLQNVAVVDQLQFPGGTGTSPATFTYTATYVKTGSPRHVVPKTHDPLSPFNWAGRMWMATNTGTFAVAYTDGSFSATGSFDSTGNFGEMGAERNGRFVERGENSAQSTIATREESHLAGVKEEKTLRTAQLFKGRIPLKQFAHSIPADSR